MGRMLQALLDRKLLQANTKVVASAALDQDEIKRLIGSNSSGDVGLVIVTGRKYTMHRYIVAP